MTGGWPRRCEFASSGSLVCFFKYLHLFLFTNYIYLMFLGMRTLTAATTTSSTYKTTQMEKNERNKHERVGPNDERCCLGRFVCFFLKFGFFFLLTNTFLGSITSFTHEMTQRNQHEWVGRPKQRAVGYERLALRYVEK
jgi:hypothetical protein